MGTRLQSEKGAFVQSPFNAFDSSEEVQFTGEYFKDISSEPTNYFTLNTLTCTRALRALEGLPEGPGEEWTFTISRVDQQSWNPLLIQTMVFSQPPSLQTIRMPDLVAASSTCVNGTDNNYWAAPVAPGFFEGFDAYNTQFVIFNVNTPLQYQGRMLLAKHPGTGLAQAHFPTDWAAFGPVEISFA